MKKNINSKIYFDLINLCPTKLKDYIQNIGFLETYYLNNDFPLQTVNQSLLNPPNFIQICLSSNNIFLIPNIISSLNYLSYDEKIRLSFLIENEIKNILESVPINYFLKYIDIMYPSHLKYIFKNRKAFEIQIFISHSKKENICNYFSFLDPHIFFKILHIFDNNLEIIKKINLNNPQKNYMIQLCNQLQFRTSIDIKNFPISFLHLIYNHHDTKNHFLNFFPHLSTYQKNKLCNILKISDILKIIKNEKNIDPNNFYWIDFTNLQKDKIGKYINYQKRLYKKNNLNIRKFKILILLSEKIDKYFIIKKNKLKLILHNLLITSWELQNKDKIQKLKQ